MESLSIYSHESYHSYLEALMASGRFGKRGPRSRLADSAKCQLAYVSQVFCGQSNFSLEQAAGIAQYLQLDDMERAYFFDLILLARAGTNEVQTFYQRRVKEVRGTQLNLSRRLKSSRALSEDHRAGYYGAWYHTAIHMLTHIAKFRTAQVIATRLSLSLSTVQRSLEYLLGIGLLRCDGFTYKPTQSDLHLTKGSPFLSKHLSNWRIQAVVAADNPRTESLHYSSVMSLHPDDAMTIREILTRAIERTREVTAESKEEESVFVCNVDFFEL